MNSAQLPNVLCLLYGIDRTLQKNANIPNQVSYERFAIYLYRAPHRNFQKLRCSRCNNAITELQNQNKDRVRLYLAAIRNFITDQLWELNWDVIKRSLNKQLKFPSEFSHLVIWISSCINSTVTIMVSFCEFILNRFAKLVVFEFFFHFVKIACK